MENDERDLSEDVPVPESFLGPEPAVSRYAVPLSTLVGGAYVAHADQVVIHPLPGVGDAGFVADAGAAAAGGADGD